MFDVSFWELVVIGVVGLIVIGPERLPEVARTVGKYVGRMRRFVSKVKDDIDREIRQEELRDTLKRHANLDDVKSILNDSRYLIEDEVQQSKEPVVKARDDDPRGNFSQSDLLTEQEKDFDNENYGLTDHRDHGMEAAPEETVQAAPTEVQTSNPPKKDDGRNEKSNS